MTITWQVDPYYPGFKTTRTRGRGTYYPAYMGNDYLGPECQKTETPAESGQPYKKVWKCYVNNPQGDRVWVAKLSAPAECQAFHICHEGMQFKAKQRYKIEFESS